MRPFFQCWFLLVMYNIQYGHCCRPAVLGQRYTITSTANVPCGESVVWQLESTMVLYDSSLPHSNPYPVMFTGSRKQLTLLEISKTYESRVFNHIVNGNIVYSCTLQLCEKQNVTLEIGAVKMILDTDPSSYQYEDIHLDYTPDMTSAKFCAYNLRPNSLIKIQESGYTRVQTITDSCVTLDITDQSPSRELTMTFKESGGCERTGSYTILLGPPLGQDPLPIMELYAPDVNSVTKTSGCKNGILNDVSFFTVRGKVNKNGSNSAAYKDTNLYFKAVADPSTNIWIPLCQPDLTVCGSNLNTDCYCESKDANGDYHIVMTIVAKSIYSGGKLMLSWNDARSPYNPPIRSNQVDYYPGIFRETKLVTLKIGSFEKTIDTDPSSDTYTDFCLDYTADMTSATFCVCNLEANSLIEIKENENTPVQTTSDSCVTLDFTDQGPNQVLTMSFTETGGCERSGSYILRISTGDLNMNW